MVDRKLRKYGELWKKDARAVGRSPDVLATMRNVLAAMPHEWNGIRVDRDKVRLSAWYLLRESAGAVGVFSAFVAAEQGNYIGLAELSRGYDLEIANQIASPHEYVEEELIPCLWRGRLVVIENMGHTDVVRLQPKAFDLLAHRFFAEGLVDTSQYHAHTIDFTPSAP